MAFYSAREHTLEKIDFTRYRYVSVIASYNTFGKCIPLYFRYMYSDGTYSDIAIDRVVYTTANSYHTAYTCDITVHDCRERILLTYHKDYNKWSVVYC